MGSPVSVVEFAGSRRLIAGRVRYPTPPEPGTILGPKDTTRELLVVLGQLDDGYTLCGYATEADIEAARTRLDAGDAPRSIAERGLPA